MFVDEVGSTEKQGRIRDWFRSETCFVSQVSDDIVSLPIVEGCGWKPLEFGWKRERRV